ncbi:MAG: hypothetical protein J0G99_16410 [Alphaproteobacteria bacterium]|nr:hypothetical protein [Alphaproteobacteria bacterium]
MGQIILAYLLDQPGKAKTSNTIFGDLYDKVFDQKFISSDLVIMLHGLYRLIESRKLAAKTFQRKISREEYGEEWIIEGIYHALYAIKLFCVGHAVDPTNFDAAKQFVDDAIDAISECFDAKEISAYRFFRLTATTTAIEQNISRRLHAGLGKAKLSNQMELF